MVANGKLTACAKAPQSTPLFLAGGSGHGVGAGRISRKNLSIEILASASKLAGMRLGSTTLVGAERYLVSTVAWCAISRRKGLHGIWPLNIGALGVTLWNLWGALA